VTATGGPHQEKTLRLRAPVHGDQGFRLKATTVSGG
jgi:hypothetical protein